MLNIISNEFFKSKNRVSGPIKVFRNLIMGLKKIGYPYVINGDLEACNKLWIYNDPAALKKVGDIGKNVKILLGPGFYFDRCIKKNIKEILKAKSGQIVCLQPSDWSKAMLQHFGYSYTPVESWPVGIDTDEFFSRPAAEADMVLIYFKQRFSRELDGVTNILGKKRLNYQVIYYGKYSEDNYKNLLKKAKYIIWVGGTESQGIAMQEALSMDVPALVWDVKKVGYWPQSPKDIGIFTKEESDYDKATVAPYFDDRCGIKFFNADELEEKISFMEDNYKNFKPREYILENLSLEKQAKDFINLYDKYWGLKFEDGYKDKLLSRKKWKNEFLWKNISKIYYFFNSIARGLNGG